jgi:restriction system protein
MGGMSFEPGRLADRLSETSGYKAGVTLSVNEICNHLLDTEYPDIIRCSEKMWVRLRSEEYEALFYKLLHRIGYTEKEYDGDYTGVNLFHKYRKIGLLYEYQDICKLYNEMMRQLIGQAVASGAKLINPTPFVKECHQKYGLIGVRMAWEKIEVFDKAVTLNPHSIGRAVEWNNPLSLNKLFTGTSDIPENGRFIDQRFINYLSKNTSKLPKIHWRKFEELTAEFFDREGYIVELGPGSNDDGVDVRIWKADSIPTEQPLFLVQCKRQKKKIERIVVKGLYSDVQFEGAEYGVVVTTSELSPAAKSTIKARGYPIREVNRDGLVKWLTKLRVPGTGIVRV